MTFLEMVFSVASIPFLTLIGIILFMPDRHNRILINLITNPEKASFEWWIFPLESEFCNKDYYWIKVWHPLKIFLIK